MSACAEQFVGFIQQKGFAESRGKLKAKKAELSKSEKRNGERNALFKGLYGDNVPSEVINGRFRMLSEGRCEKQQTAQEEIWRLRKATENLRVSAANVDRFFEIARKFTDMKEPSPEILRIFIGKIVLRG